MRASVVPGDVPRGGLNLLVYEIFPNDLVFRNYARATNVLRTEL